MTGAIEKELYQVLSADVKRVIRKIIEAKKKAEEDRMVMVEYNSMIESAPEKALLAPPPRLLLDGATPQHGKTLPTGPTTNDVPHQLTYS